MLEELLRHEQRLLQEGDFRQRAALLHHAVEAYPDLHWLRRYLVSALLNTGDVEAAIAVCREAISAYPEVPEFHLDLCAILAECGRTEDALSELEQARRIGSSDPETLAALGHGLFQFGQVFAGIDQYREAIAQAGVLAADMLMRLGDDLQHADRIDDARATYEEAIRREPGNSSGYKGLADLLYAADRTAAALQACRTAVSISPGDTSALLLLGECLERLGQPSEVEEVYRRAIAAVEGDPLLPADEERMRRQAEAHHQLGLFLHEHGRSAEASSELHQAVRLAPDDWDFRTLFGIVLAAQGMEKEAVAEWEAAVKVGGVTFARRAKDLLDMASR
jgi:protein O-GlcNAc transferase